MVPTMTTINLQRQTAMATPDGNDIIKPGGNTKSICREDRGLGLFLSSLLGIRNRPRQNLIPVCAAALEVVFDTHDPATLVTDGQLPSKL
mmetsp:Transcript_17083/g.26137  ORF Transcript_17083/g.26137 Transcript_17083/m.26137 type:complete len:90 (-) Transcript_17083:280-549(-)